MTSLEALFARMRLHSAALVGVGIACAAAFRTRYLVLNSGETLTRAGIFFDDAFFYTTLARNFVKLGFLTLDGRTPTNGVQPFWQALLIAFHWLLPSWELVAMSAALSWVLYAAASGLLGALLWRVLRPRGALPVAVVVGVALLGTKFYGTVLRGLETALFLFVFSVWLWASELLRSARDAGTARQWHYAAFGVVCACLFFARTDWFVASIASFVWVCSMNKPFSQGRWQLPQVRTVAAFSLPLAAIVMPYLVHNWAVHGHPMPISGRVKLHYMTKALPTLKAYLASDEWRGALTLLQKVFKISQKAKVISPGTWGLWAAAIGVGAVLWRKVPRARLWLGTVFLHWAFMQFVYRELRPYTNYYFAAEILTVCVVVGIALNWLIAQLPWRESQRAYALPGVALLLVTFWWAKDADRSIRPTARWETRLQLARNLDRLPSKARVGAFWPGVFAYYSQRPVFPLDGIIGSQDYFEDVVKEKAMLDYAKEQGIEYIVSHVPPRAIQGSGRPSSRDWASGALVLWKQCKYLRPTKYRSLKRGRGWFVYKLEDKPVGWAKKCRGRR